VRAFRYRLAAALMQAEHAESRRQIELAQAERALSRGDELAESARAMRVQLEAKLRDALAAGEVEASAVETIQHEVEAAEARLGRALRVREELRGRVAEARERLVDAALRRRILEKHREAQAEVHRRAEARAEMAHLDELANVHGSRRRAAVREAEGSEKCK
jgi:flagellar export protein FliJ